MALHTAHLLRTLIWLFITCTNSTVNQENQIMENIRLIEEWPPPNPKLYRIVLLWDDEFNNPLGIWKNVKFLQKPRVIKYSSKMFKAIKFKGQM